ncbi:MAG: hypothetical protein AAF368_07230 [Planctomycetota bacterium]
MLDPEELRAAVERDIADLLPGGRLLDADLRVEESVPIDFVLADRDARLTLVLLVLGGAEESVFTALDALSFARRHASALGTSLFPDATDPSLRPRVILLAEHFAERALHRLTPLLDSVQGDLRLHELRRVESRSGRRIYFVPLSERRGSSAVDEASSIEQFLAGLPDDVRTFGRELIGRISRVDHELECVVASGRVLWSLEGLPACALEFREERGYFVMHVPGADRALIDDELSAQGALDRVVARSLELFDLSSGAEPRAIPLGGIDGGAEGDFEEDLFAVEGLEPGEGDILDPLPLPSAAGAEPALEEAGEGVDPDLGPLRPLDSALLPAGALGSLAAGPSLAEFDERKDSPSDSEELPPIDALDGADLDEDDLDELVDDEPEGNVLPPAEGELLSPEELEAFRDF